MNALCASSRLLESFSHSLFSKAASVISRIFSIALSWLTQISGLRQMIVNPVVLTHKWTYFAKVETTPFFRNLVKTAYAVKPLLYASECVRRIQNLPLPLATIHPIDPEAIALRAGALESAIRKTAKVARIIATLCNFCFSLGKIELASFSPAAFASLSWIKAGSKLFYLAVSIYEAAASLFLGAIVNPETGRMRALTGKDFVLLALKILLSFLGAALSVLSISKLLALIPCQALLHLVLSTLVGMLSILRHFISHFEYTAIA